MILSAKMDGVTSRYNLVLDRCPSFPYSTDIATNQRKPIMQVFDTTAARKPIPDYVAPARNVLKLGEGLAKFNAPVNGLAIADHVAPEPLLKQSTDWMKPRRK